MKNVCMLQSGIDVAMCVLDCVLTLAYVEGQVQGM